MEEPPLTKEQIKALRDALLAKKLAAQATSVPPAPDTASPPMETPPAKPKTFREERLAMFDRQYDEGNSDYTTPVLEPPTSPLTPTQNESGAESEPEVSPARPADTDTRRYYPNGELAWEALPGGRERMYREDKTLKRERLPDGTRVYYREDGKTKEVEYRSNGDTIYYRWDGGSIISIRYNSGIIEEYDREGRKTGRFRYDEEGRRVDEPIVPTPAPKAEKASQVEFFSAEFIRQQIGNLLASNENIKEVVNIKIDGRGNEIMLNIRVKAGPVDSDIGIQAVLENKKNAVAVKSYKIDAGWLIKSSVEGMIAPKLNEVSEMLKEFIEKEDKKGRKVEKMEIENGQLKVTYGTSGSTQDVSRTTSRKEGAGKILVPELGPVRKPTLETKIEKAEAVARLREAVASAQTIIQEEGERMEKRKQVRETLLVELELVKDKIKNPFKYFIIDHMSPKAFICLYQRRKEEVTLKDINSVSGNNITGEDGKKICVFTPEFILPGRNDSVYFSSNGFSLQLLNKDEITVKKEGRKIVMVDSPNAKYRLVHPNWTHDPDDRASDLEGWKKLLDQRAQQYQAWQISLFEKQSKQVK
ncbi:hypothetical protein A3A95_00195 [Candidatus Nomurabacteria bacterium RIFCSPLOWO2_01_FULL_39_18]|uniref:Uncharacterized protein n=1 Tax=Candidatus Nomurabacteria bacterium RIFCSPHIGHO2_01_FULL_40_24b TaxID=1801739 RepID=A0A1F6V9C8_9BACT|nr:MAG: hypothetical protein A2647_03045 [Candidatus Nomurabacteria bacterium RIFCSPHIGHO2_01_FULL_40_24b]OGI90498.1 MAG: hypothetical protein A3A95_00195 [Candidatus Nomurabacteria bacterium RIFCSPLOWO2_01_FULL_39_18]